jgi:hypothetical protein
MKHKISPNISFVSKNGFEIKMRNTSVMPIAKSPNRTFLSK